MATTRQHSGGRRPKGDRAQFSGRFPRDHLEIYRKEAEDLDVPVADYIALLCARAQGLPIPEYIWEDRDRRQANRARREPNPNQDQLEYAS